MGTTISGLILDTMIIEAKKAKLYYTGLWPLYWVTYAPPIIGSPLDSIYNIDRGLKTKYFLGRKRMVAHIVRMKLKYPDLIIEKY